MTTVLSKNDFQNSQFFSENTTFLPFYTTVEREAINSVFSYIKTHPQEMSQVFTRQLVHYNADNLLSNCSTTISETA